MIGTSREDGCTVVVHSCPIPTRTPGRHLRRSCGCYSTRRTRSARCIPIEWAGIVFLGTPSGAERNGPNTRPEAGG